MTTSRKKTRSTYHHGDLRGALIRAGVKLVAKYGIGGLTMARVAKAAQVAVSAPYRHFDDRNALLAAIAAEGFGRLTAQFETVGDGKNRVQRLALVYVGFALENREHFRVMFEGQLDKSLYPELQAAGDRTFAVLAQAAQTLSGTRNPSRATATVATATVATATIWSVVHGFAVIAIADGFSVFNVALETLLARTVAQVVSSYD